MARVFVAMSGGVDSSVAAAVLAEAGHDVVGVTMRLLPEGDRETACCSAAAADAARRVCEHLGVPHRTLDLRAAFRDRVIEPFCDAYAAGRTPNPCIACNERLKFGELWRRVEAEGADFLATGHYARVVDDDARERRLARGADRAKDQSYFLYRLSPELLQRTLFPVGGLTKAEVRRVAAERMLPTAHTPESQEVCFAEDGTAAFVKATRPEAATPGPIVDAAGRMLGSHRGLGGYTVGQRRGLGISSPEPLYVLRIVPAVNTIVAGPAAALAVVSITCGEVFWSGPAEARVTVQVRYRHRPVPARALRTPDGVLRILLDEPVTGVAPGQAAVCYQGDIVLGGGVIEETA